MPPEDALSATEPTCFEFRNHGQPVAGDTTKYPIGPGEQYVCYNYDVPWNEPAELVSWQTLYDNQTVLHHWLLYSTPLGRARRQLLAVHRHARAARRAARRRLGGRQQRRRHARRTSACACRGADRSFLLEWHFYNSTGAAQQDGSRDPHLRAARGHAPQHRRHDLARHREPRRPRRHARRVRAATGAAPARTTRARRSRSSGSGRTCTSGAAT